MSKALDYGSQGPYACILFDSTLKVVVCNPRHEKLMIQIIEMLIPGKHIESIEFLDKEKHGLEINEKSVTFDLLCKDKKTGESFLVELQNAKETSFLDRTLSYSTYPIREQMEERAAEIAEGKRKNRMDYTLTPVYVLSLLNFSIGHDNDQALDEDGLISRYSLRNDRNGELMTNALHFVYVEMGRLPYGPDEDGKCKTLLEMFVFSVKYMHILKKRPAGFVGEFWDLLFEACTKAKMSLVELQNYDKAMYTELDRIAQIDYARNEGREEGEKKGREEGASKTAREIALRMQQMGLSPEQIKEATGVEL